MKTFLLFLTLCTVAATLPFLSRRTEAESPADAFPGWNAGPVNPAWTPQALGPREEKFASNFPGRIAVFTDGTRTYIVRWVNQPTRQLHSVWYCLRALGYTVEPRPIREKNDHTLWAATAARRGAESLIAYERIFSDGGDSWTDFSAWFWHTTLGRAQGPWWTVTELSPASA